MKKHFLIQKSEGSAAVEFALLAPILFLMMFGIVEFGIMMFVSSVIENAATSASRIGLTGNDDEGNFGDTDARRVIVEKEIMRYAGGIIDPSKVKFTPTVHGRISNAGGGGARGLGSGGDAVTYEVTYDWEFFTPFLGTFFTNGVYTISSAIIVKNEDF